jgi:DNA-binding transcriptional LysR family regulator
LDNWDEIRTAYQVALNGTVSGASDVLGVHHATVIRHIDALERRLGVRLFQRHARGYTPTEAGRDLLVIAQRTDEQFSQLSSRIKGLGEGVSGELIITAITGVERLLMPVLAGFQDQHPSLIIRLLTDMRVFRLDHGEAHVAIRAGDQPSEPDYIVQPLLRMPSALFASTAYAEAHGLPAGPEEFAAHRFIAADSAEARAPFYRWLRANVPPENQTFRVTDPFAAKAAVEAGLGIGFIDEVTGRSHPDLVRVMGPLAEWESPLWIVTHVDLHRTAKVQGFVTALKTAAKGWTCT